MEEELTKNVSISLLNSFCVSRESNRGGGGGGGLSNQAKRPQELKEWTRAYEQLNAWEEIVISSDDEEELARQITMSSVFRTQYLEDKGHKLKRMFRDWFLCCERGKEKGA